MKQLLQLWDYVASLSQYLQLAIIWPIECQACTSFRYSLVETRVFTAGFTWLCCLTAADLFLKSLYGIIYWYCLLLATNQLLEKTWHIFMFLECYSWCPCYYISSLCGSLGFVSLRCLLLALFQKYLIYFDLSAWLSCVKVTGELWVVAAGILSVLSLCCIH